MEDLIVPKNIDYEKQHKVCNHFMLLQNIDIDKLF